MTPFIKASFTIGVILTLVGSFLPWTAGGDFIPYWSFGIQIYPSLKDSGGLLIVMLTLIITTLVLHIPSLIKRPLLWSIPFSSLLVIISAFHLYQFLLSHESARGAIGSPVVQIGLIMVCIGSVLLLFATSTKYFMHSRMGL